MPPKNNHHNAYVNSKGEQVLRISQVIKMLAKDQLIMWAHMLGWKRIDYKKELERTANIGTFAHAMIELYYSKMDLCVYEFENFGIYRFSDKQEAYNAAESFFKWLRKYERHYKVLATEKTLIGEKVGGTIDCIIESPRDPNKVILVDYKTSSRIHFTHFLQLSGYIDLYESINGKNSTDGAMVMRLDKRCGKPAQTMFISREDLEPYIECFKSLMSVAYLTKALENSMAFDAVSFHQLFDRGEN